MGNIRYTNDKNNNDISNEGSRRSRNGAEEGATDPGESLFIVLVRHGETSWNEERRLQGNADPGPGLTSRGIHQSRCVGHRYSEVDCVYVSPLRRCTETLQYVVASTGDNDMPVREDAGLKERNLGIFTGRLADREILECIRRGGSDGVETFDELMQRSKRVIHGIVKDAWTRGYEKIMVVSHGGFISSIARWIDPNRKYSRVSNGSVSQLVVSGHHGQVLRWKIETWNAVSHIEGGREYTCGDFGGGLCG